MTSLRVIEYLKGKWLHAGFQKYLKNTGWLFFGHIFTLAVSFFVGAYVARYLGPEQYGLLSYVLSFTVIFAAFSNFGIDNILVRELISKAEREKEILGSALRIKLIAGVTAFILCVVTALLFHKFSLLTFFIAIYAAHFLFQPFNVAQSYFQAKIKNDYVVRIQVGITIILALTKLSLVIIGASLAAIVTTYLLETILLSVAVLIQYRLTFGSMRLWIFDRSTARQLLIDSWPFIFSSVFYFVYMKIDQIIIKNLLGDYQVGIYSAGVKPSEIWYFVPTLICTALFPAVVNAWRTGDLALYRLRTRRLAALIIIVAFVMSVGVYFVADQLIFILYGIEFMPAADIVRIYVWSGIAVALTAVIQQVLTTENKTKLIALFTFVGAMMNVILNFVLIPSYGVLGAAYATVVSYASIPVLFILYKTYSRK